MDVSINIVHYNTPRLLRQTLASIRRAAPRLNYEVIVVDNNPTLKVGPQLLEEFPEVRIVDPNKNLGFGQGMNAAFKEARGRYLLVFNPDVSMLPGSLEELVRHLDENSRVGIVGARLNDPGGQLQHSCYTFMQPRTVFYRRLPFISRLESVKSHLDDYLMADWSHDETKEVDYILGACMLVRQELIKEIGTFDPGFFMYFEEQDLCRRAWLAGWRVVYHPDSIMVHYHRRETAEGGIVSQLLNPVTHHQIKSAIYYFKKYRGATNPRQGVCPVSTTSEKDDSGKNTSAKN